MKKRRKLKLDKIYLQLFGQICPPFYGEKDLLKTAKKISDIDVKINRLAIEREEYVKDFKKQIEDLTANKD